MYAFNKTKIVNVNTINIVKLLKIKANEHQCKQTWWQLELLLCTIFQISNVLDGWLKTPINKPNSEIIQEAMKTSSFAKLLYNPTILLGKLQWAFRFINYQWRRAVIFVGTALAVNWIEQQHPKSICWYSQSFLIRKCLFPLRVREEIQSESGYFLCLKPLSQKHHQAIVIQILD